MNGARLPGGRRVPWSGPARQLTGTKTQRPWPPGGYAMACEALTSTRTASVSSAFSSAKGAVVFTE
jgi:hypothetical protein